MDPQPTLETERLLLRPLRPHDAPTLARRAGRREIADTTISILHPYSEEQARQWTAGNVDLFAKGKSAVFGMELKREGTLAGTIGLREIDAEHSQAELGFWVAVECWGQGYATELKTREPILATGKSPEPADRDVCPADWTAIVRIAGYPPGG